MLIGMHKISRQLWQAGITNNCHYQKGRTALCLISESPVLFSANENCVGYIIDIKKEIANIAYNPIIPPHIITAPHKRIFIKA